MSGQADFSEGLVIHTGGGRLWHGLSASAIFSLNGSAYLRCRSCGEPREALFRKGRRDEVPGIVGKFRRGGLPPKGNGEDFFRQKAECPHSRYDRTVALVF